MTNEEYIKYIKYLKSQEWIFLKNKKLKSSKKICSICAVTKNIG